MIYSGEVIGDASSTTYSIGTTPKFIRELPGGGTDKVIAQTNYVLPDNVENLEIWGAYAGVGNALANRIVGNGESNQLEGRGGDDTLSGGGASDIFIFGPASGRDTILDFKAGTAVDADIIRLQGGLGYTSFDQVRGLMTQRGADVELRLSANDSVTIKNATVDTFTASNFQLGLDTSRLTLSFADEFDKLSLWNGSSGTWKSWYGGGNYKSALDNRTLRGNGEEQIYVDPQLAGTGPNPLGLNPFRIDNGVLTITATDMPAAAKSALWDYSYISGALSTRGTFAQTYGYFEAQLQLPAGKGAWPAFWMMPADGSWPPELDIMEAYGNEQAVQTVHSKETGSHTQSYTKTFVDGATAGMHRYGLLWTKDMLTWYIDGTAVKTAPTPADMHKPFYMMVNLAVTDGTTGPLTAEYKVDYIRAYTLSDVGVVTHAITAAPVIEGSAGADVLNGGSGHDVIMGMAGSDTIDGGAGNDHLYGSSPNGGADGADVIRGGDGSDYIQGNAGNDTLSGGAGSDRIQGGADNDQIDGGDGNDTINGNRGDDMIIGGAGNDFLRGGQGNDTLNGGDGNDILSGDAGSDALTGGAGVDIFQFSGAASTLAAPDRITDFQDGVDFLSLGFAPAAVLIGGPQASLSAAAAQAQSLFDAHPGAQETAAMRVGGETYLFYASNGGATVDSAINLGSLDPNAISSVDFV